MATLGETRKRQDKTIKNREKQKETVSDMEKTRKDR